MHNTSKILISDQEPSFKALKCDMTNHEEKKINEWMREWVTGKENLYLEKSFGTQFIFRNPESCELMRLVEQMHKTITSSKLSLKKACLKSS